MTYSHTTLSGMSGNSLKNIVISLGDNVQGYEIRSNVLYVAYLKDNGDVVPLCYEASTDGTTCRELAPYELGEINEWPPFVVSKLTP